MPFTATAMTIVDRVACGLPGFVAQQNRVEFIDLCEQEAQAQGHAQVELIDAAWAERRYFLWD